MEAIMLNFQQIRWSIPARTGKKDVFYHVVQTSQAQQEKSYLLLMLGFRTAREVVQKKGGPSTEPTKGQILHLRLKMTEQSGRVLTHLHGREESLRLIEVLD